MEFRVWDKTRRDMIYRPRFLSGVEEGYAINTTGELLRYGDAKFYPFLDKLDETLFEIQEDTGKKDKDGRKIHKGDIVEWECEFVPGNNKGIVVYNKNLTMFVLEIITKKKNFILHPLSILENLKVLGNIYENPELIAK